MTGNGRKHGTNLRLRIHRYFSEVSHQRRRDTGGAQDRQPLRCRSFGEYPVQHGFKLLAMDTAKSVAREVGMPLQIGAPDCTAKTGPKLLTPDCDREAAVPRLKHSIGSDCREAGAERTWRLSRFEIGHVV